MFISKKKIELNQYVIAESLRGIEIGQVICKQNYIHNNKLKFKPIIRLANDKDIIQYNKNMLLASEAYLICNKKILSYNLNMKLINTEVILNQKKILFYFYATNRIDFRYLVKDLAYIFKTRIEMRQLNIKDKCKIYGGIGICGRELCCSLFIKTFDDFCINNNDPYNKKKLSNINNKNNIGSCGKTMCCLNYEHYK